MSISTMINSMPKMLATELKETQLPASAFTDENKRTVKEGYDVLVPHGLKTMLRLRQELLVLGYKTEQTESARINLLREIEVLRYFLAEVMGT